MRRAAAHSSKASWWMWSRSGWCWGCRTVSRRRVARAATRQWGSPVAAWRRVSCALTHRRAFRTVPCGSAHEPMSASTTATNRWVGACCVGCGNCFSTASMSDATLPFPDVAAGCSGPRPGTDRALPALWRYAERADVEAAPLDRWLRLHAGGAMLRWTGGLRRRRLARFARAVTAAGAAALALDDAALAAAARSAGVALRRHAPDRHGLVWLFALVREAASRSLGCRPYETQVMGAAALWRGAIAEMATGEGK